MSGFGALARLAGPDDGDRMVACAVEAARARVEEAKAAAPALTRVRTSSADEACCPNCAEMAEELRQLRDALFGERMLAPIMAWGGATLSEARVFAALLARPSATKTALHLALYGLDADGGAELKIVDVLVCKLRNKLARRGHGDIIETVWGFGYQINADNRARLTAMFESGAIIHAPVLLPAPNKDLAWPDASATRGRALWLEGKSASAIARLLAEESLGEFTRNAVLAKARRDKWGDRDRNGALLASRRLGDV